MIEFQANPLQPGSSASVLAADSELPEPDRLLLTENFLVYELVKLPKVHVFFCLMGQLWPESDWNFALKACQYVWSAFVRIFTVWGFIYGIIVMALSTSLSYYSCLGLSICLQTSILLPTIPAMSKRLRTKCNAIDLEFFGPSIVLCYFVLLFAVVCGVIVGISTYCLDDQASCTGVTFHLFAMMNMLGQITMSCLLALNTLFVLVDCRVSVKLVDELIEAHGKRKMSIAMFNEYRSNYLQRVSSNYWTYNSVLFIAIFNILILIILAYFHVEDVYAWFLPFVKEIPFVLVSLYYATAVNEKADKLTRMLGTTIWSSKDIAEDHTRLFYFSNSEAEKISFTLSGMRLKKTDLLVRIGASLLAFVVGLLKTAVLDS